MGSLSENPEAWSILQSDLSTLRAAVQSGVKFPRRLTRTKAFEHGAPRWPLLPEAAFIWNRLD
jgi:hypothetical protein